MKPSRDSILGEVILADQVISEGMSATRRRNTIFLLAGSVALMMTGFGIIMPVFARRLGELGAGVEALGLMTMSFALAQLVAAPFMGALADRIGRRPLILLSLATFALANVGFLLADSIQMFVAIRAAEGALSAGLFPAAMGFVADVSPKRDRARWVGVIMGSYAAGFFLGPIVGGLLYDSLGFAAPFLASAIMATLAFIVAFMIVPETRTAEVRKREQLQKRRFQERHPGKKESLLESLPRPLRVFAALLAIDFVMIFAFAFVEPEMIFYVYDDLGWTTVQFGVVVAVYGLTTVLGQGFLGRLSDQYGRRPMIVFGTLLNAGFYAGLALVTSFPIFLLVAVIAGLGESLVMPALSAFILDITNDRHRSRVMGIKESAAALGGVAGPLLVVAISDYSTPTQVFTVAFVLMLVTAAIALIFLRVPQKRAVRVDDGALEYATQRAMTAQAVLHGIVTAAQVERAKRYPTGSWP
ncbi:MAG: MFS transporter [Chloroflexota bacterium]|nr:MFS transporter [Chloroflexota bacterium]